MERDEDAALPELVGRLNRDQVPYLVIGAATNTLLASDELPGLTIKLSMARISIDGDAVSVSAGTLMPKVAADMARAGRAGLEFAAGVPGTVGGSVFGNAGAFGGEVRDRLLRAEVVDPQGRRQVMTAAECAFDYRDSVFKQSRDRWVITSATFATTSEPAATVRARLLEVQKHRRATQPIEQRSLSSTFKNPPGDSARRLIDTCGLKGLRSGGAQVSPRHSTFIVKLGGGL